MIKFKSKRERKKEMVKTIKILRKDGGTYEEIAEHFNKIEYFTVSGSKWYTQSLHRFFKKHSS